MNTPEIKWPSEMLPSNNIICIPPPGANISYEPVKIIAHIEQRMNELKEENKWLKQQIELKNNQIRQYLN